MEVTRLSPALGATIGGVDLSRPISDRDRDGLVHALVEHQLLHVPGQHLDDDQHAAAVRLFGPLAVEGFGDAASEVGFVSNQPGGILGSTAASWHIDYGFFEHPYEAISLYGLAVPSGTVTWFVNAVAAARDLPGPLRRRVESLTARHVVDVRSPAGSAGVRVRLGRLDETYPHAVRPVLWSHRVTGEAILGVWEQQTDAILPLAPDESTALIEELFAHLYQPHHIYVHRWAPDDLVIWDNHAVQHSRPDVGTGQPRILRRVCVGRTQDLSIFAGRRYGA